MAKPVRRTIANFRSVGSSLLDILTLSVCAGEDGSGCVLGIAKFLRLGVAEPDLQRLGKIDPSRCLESSSDFSQGARPKHAG